MKIIDAHFHYSNIESFKQAARQNGVNYSKGGFERESKANNIVGSICMGLSETVEGAFPDKKAETPMLCELEEFSDKMYYCAGINPYNLEQKAVLNLENIIQDKQCVGLKIYAGYYHYNLTDEVYDPVYKLARQYNLPIVIHSGDTYSERGLLKYSHPLQVDELAVKHTEQKFIIAHLGNPWLMDTAEVLYKNKNVFADLSGLQVGDHKLFERFRAQDLYLNMFKTALILADSYDKLIYGSDWPLVSMDIYIDFIKRIIPREHYEDIFYHNAQRVFTKMII